MLNGANPAGRFGSTNAPGVWTGPKVARYVRTRWGITIGPVTAWRWLRTLGFTLQVPRPSHPRSADPPTRRAWKKTYDAG